MDESQKKFLLMANDIDQAQLDLPMGSIRQDPRPDPLCDTKRVKKKRKSGVSNKELSMNVKSSISSYEDAKFAQIMYMDNVSP